MTHSLRAIGLIVVAISLPVCDSSSGGASTTSEQWPAPLQNWVAMGEPVADEEFIGLIHRLDTVPGSAVRMAWSDRGDRLGGIGLFVVMVRLSEEGFAESFPEETASSGDHLAYCLLEYGYESEFGDLLSTTWCWPTPDQFVRELAFGVNYSGLSSCDLPIVLPTVQQLSVWGLPASADSLIVELENGDRLVVAPMNGIAQVVWEGERSIRSIRFDGATGEQIALLSRYSDDEARISCS